MYVIAFWFAWAILPYLGEKRRITMSRDDWTRVIAWGALGVLVGGRLGYVCLYDLEYFLANPLEIFTIWHGGMSSHGGFIGAALGVWMAVRREGVSILAIADVISIPAAIGLALGRIGNITNGEFGMYPYYEAIWDLCIAIVCYVLLHFHSTQPPLEKGRSRGDSPPYEGGVRGGGNVFALVLILYGIGRFLLEYVRPQEWSYIYMFTRGQAYTIPLLVVGVLLWIYADKHRI